MIEPTKSDKLHIGFIGVGVMGRPMVLGSVTHQLYKMAKLKGWGHLDDLILIKLMQNITGLDQEHT